MYEILHCFFACSTLVAALNAEEENDPPTYKDAFPPLPEKAACLEPAQEPAGAWSKIRPIKASVITQVSTKEDFPPLLPNTWFSTVSFEDKCFSGSLQHVVAGEKVLQ